MQNTPLLSILKALSREQYRALDKFIASPYHVTHDGVVHLYKVLKSELSNPDLDQEAVYQRLFPNGGAPKRKVYDFSNYLLEALETFMALEIWREDPQDRYLRCVKNLRKMRLTEEAGAMIKYAHKKREQSRYRGVDYLRSEYRSQYEIYQLSLQQGRAKSFNAQELSDAQDLAFISEKLRVGCLMLSHEAVTKQQYDKRLIGAVLQFLEGHPYLENPAVAVYYHGYYAQLGEENENHFNRLKTLLEQHAGAFSVEEMHDLFLMAVNYCIRRINRHEMRFFREVFDLYRTGLDHGALLEDGVLSRWTYNNISLTALKLREFDWLYEFLHRYAEYLPKAHREGALHFGLAGYYFERKMFKEAMHHLLYMEYDDILQNLAAKTMLCKIYYTLDESDALENQLAGMSIYLRRKKVVGYHRENYNSIIKNMKKLMALNWNDARAVAALRDEIAAAPVITERNWLLEQLSKP